MQQKAGRKGEHKSYSREPEGWREKTQELLIHC